MRIHLASALLCLFSVAQTAQADFTPPITEVLTYGPEAELLQISAPPLSEIAQDAWDNEFLSSPYFGAFVLSKSGGYGYATSTNSRDAAREIAMMECLAQNNQCRLIAEIVPTGFAEPAENAATVTREVAEYLQELATQPRFRAAAISADGAYSLVWGYETPEDAEAAAMSDCESFLRQPQSPGDPTWVCVLLPGLN